MADLVKELQPDGYSIYWGGSVPNKRRSTQPVYLDSPSSSSAEEASQEYHSTGEINERENSEEAFSEEDSGRGKGTRKTNTGHLRKATASFAGTNRSVNMGPIKENCESTTPP